MDLKILPHSFTNIEIQKHCHNESRFNGVYSCDNLPKNMKDRAHVKISMNMLMCVLIVLLYIFQTMMLLTFNGFELNIILTKSDIRNGNMKTNICKTHANN